MVSWAPSRNSCSTSATPPAAVIDKDSAAARLALDLAADVLLIVTDVPKAYINYRQDDERALDTVSVAEMESYVCEGHFKAGSMGPKVEAALRLARAGKIGIIASLTELLEAVEGTAGTRVVGAATSMGMTRDGSTSAPENPVASSAL